MVAWMKSKDALPPENSFIKKVSSILKMRSINRQLFSPFTCRPHIIFSLVKHLLFSSFWWFHVISRSTIQLDIFPQIKWTRAISGAFNCLMSFKWKTLKSTFFSKSTLLRSTSRGNKIWNIHGSIEGGVVTRKMGFTVCKCQPAIEWMGPVDSTDKLKYRILKNLTARRSKIKWSGYGRPWLVIVHRQAISCHGNRIRHWMLPGIVYRSVIVLLFPYDFSCLNTPTDAPGTRHSTDSGQ